MSSTLNNARASADRLLLLWAVSLVTPDELITGSLVTKSCHWNRTGPRLCETSCLVMLHRSSIEASYMLHSSMYRYNRVHVARDIKTPDFDLWPDLDLKVTSILISLGCFGCVLRGACKCRLARLSTTNGSRDTSSCDQMTKIPAQSLFAAQVRDNYNRKPS